MSAPPLSSTFIVALPFVTVMSPSALTAPTSNVPDISALEAVKAVVYTLDHLLPVNPKLKVPEAPCG